MSSRYTTFAILLLFSGSAILAQEPQPAKSGPCTSSDWVSVGITTNENGSRVHTFTNVGPYPIFLHLASVQASGDFPPRSVSVELGHLNVGETRRLTENVPGRFAYEFRYINAAYLDFGKGIFTRCSDRANEEIKHTLPDICRAAGAAQSCFDQANREIANLRKHAP
jgi:hypothetical protein